MSDDETHPTRWQVTERALVAFRRTSVSVAEVRLPDGVSFKQAVLRVAPAAMCVLVDDEQRVLMIRRHRFIIDSWVWELPGGYVDEGEDLATAAAREAEEETGWRPACVEHLASFQPMTGNADALQHVYLGTYPHRVHQQPDANETAEMHWIPLSDVPAMLAGSVLGAGSVIGLLAARDRLGVH